MTSVINNKKTLKMIQNCILFKDLEADEISLALNFFDADIRNYRKGEFIQTVLRPFERFGLVLSGEVRVYMDDIDGDSMIMANVSPGDTFGESLCLLNADSPVYVEAVTDASILSMSARKLHSPENYDKTQHMYMLRFSSMLATRALSMNDRIQVLSNISLREKIITFLSQFRSKYSSYEFTIPFDRASMAIYLGTDRASLSRELSKMKSEGIIDFSKNKFIIKK